MKAYMQFENSKKLDFLKMWKFFAAAWKWELEWKFNVHIQNVMSMS
jgi:hypothetical protein